MPDAPTGPHRSDSDPPPRESKEQPSPLGDASLALGPVALAVRDVERTGAFYREVLGLEPHEGSDATVRYGPRDGEPLVELLPAAVTADPPRGPRRPPGLFHTAILLPTRADLGRWLRQAHAATGGRLGQADHLVSEAFYLDDPEGNGVEVYRDRPRAEWKRDPADPDRIRMATDPADIEGIVAAAGSEAWQGAPAGTSVGHVHLRVSELGPARAFWCDVLGFEVMATYPGALFLARDGYHHHIGLNTWQSAGQPPAPDGAPGLQAVRMRLRADVYDTVLGRIEARGLEHEPESDERTAVRDPDGLRIDLQRVA